MWPYLGRWPLRSWCKSREERYAFMRREARRQGFHEEIRFFQGMEAAYAQMVKKLDGEIS